MKKAFMLCCFILILPILLLGCEQSTKDSFEQEKNDAIDEQMEKSEVPEQKAEVTVKILGISEEDFKRYYSGFTDKYPHIKVEAIKDGYMDGNTFVYHLLDQEWLDQNKPDLLMITAGNTVFRKLITDDKLTDISVILPEEDLNALYPPIVDYMQQLGNGRIYGVPESFNMMGLYYNKDLFDKYKIEYPRDQMTWMELLQLANRFAVAGAEKDGITGLRMYAPLGYFLDVISRTNKSIFDASGKADLHDPEWKELLGAVFDGIKNGSILLDQEGKNCCYFESGQVAMNLSYAGNAILQSNPVPNFQYGLVTEPINPSHPNKTNHLVITSILAINAVSEHKQEAWELLHHMISETKNPRDINKYNMPVLTEKIEQLEQSDPKYATLFKLQDNGDILESDLFKYGYGLVSFIYDYDFTPYLKDQISFDELLTDIEKVIDTRKLKYDAEARQKEK